MYRAKAGKLKNTELNEEMPVHNSHWLHSEDGAALGQPSNYVGYYDATSLYPSSSKFGLIVNQN